ncbi:MAG TPA: aspartyl-phosphate phosphatase Spo0E family protein [Clostridia bacterium]|nr:aspartyl-phosphate phosphatase Spo0E family protein [Clostridia bacterium]
MNRRSLSSMIRKKKAELNRLVAQRESLQDREVYEKSCELDQLVVAYMKLQVKKNPRPKVVRTAV